MGSAPGFSWRDGKSDRNLREHGVPLRFGILLFQDERRLEKLAKTVHGELRFMAIGEVQGRMISCVFTFDGVTRHLLSVRLASRKERRSYAAQMDDRGDRS